MISCIQVGTSVHIQAGFSNLNAKIIFSLQIDINFFQLFETKVLLVKFKMLKNKRKKNFTQSKLQPFNFKMTNSYDV